MFSFYHINLKQNFIFKAASILRVGALKKWIKRSYAEGYLKKGLESLKAVCTEFIFKECQNEQNDHSKDKIGEEKNTISSPNNFDYLDTQFFVSQDESQVRNESLAYKRDKELEAEIIFFSAILGNKKFTNSDISTIDFWLKHRSDMPKLFDLQIILLNIPASSSFIERFFSLSGIVCDSRRLNLNDELIVMRSLMKANMTILNEMHEC